MTDDDFIRGIVVIIDDALNPDSTQQDDDIFDIIKQLKNDDIPIKKFFSLPLNCIKHLSHASFILIDWRLSDDISTEERLDGISIPDTIIDQNAEDVTNFLRELKKVYFGPVFIFSSLSEEEIQDELCRHLHGDEEKDEFLNYIFIKSKTDIKTRGLKEHINDLFRNNLSLYVLNEWEKVLYNSKNELFWNLFSLDHKWPKVFWDIYSKDGVNPEYQIGHLLSRNLISRMNNYSFDSNYFKGDYNVQREHLRKVIKGERFIPFNSTLNCPGSGDLFFCKNPENESSNKYYFINIRPECDCISRDRTDDEIKLYLIKGTKCSEGQVQSLFNEEYHRFNEREDFTIIPFIEHRGNEIVLRFNFDELIITEYGKIKEYKIGRLLTPYITYLRQKYSAYLQREGLMPTPNKAINTEETQ